MTLEGLRVVVTRPRHAAAELAEGLEALGATVVLCPTIELAAPEDDEPLRRALERIDSFDWIVFTSANAVAAVVEAAAGHDRALRQRDCAAVGPKTAAALRRLSWEPRLVARAQTGAGLAEALGNVDGLRILFPRADIARRELPGVLRGRGADVVEVVAYRTVEAAPARDVVTALAAGVDLMTFTSPSTVRGFARIAADLPAGTLDRAAAACIGPTTAAQAREIGYDVKVQPEEHTVRGLLEAIRTHYREEE
jgi:uroporphyrinogen III methyltransferase/synthase